MKRLNKEELAAALLLVYALVTVFSWRYVAPALSDAHAWGVLPAAAALYGAIGAGWLLRQPGVADIRGRLARVVQLHLTGYVFAQLTYVTLFASYLGIDEGAFRWSSGVVFVYATLVVGLLFSWRVGLARIESWQRGRSADEMVEDMVAQPLDHVIVWAALPFLFALLRLLPGRSPRDLALSADALRALVLIAGGGIAVSAYGYLLGRRLHRPASHPSMMAILKSRGTLAGACLVVMIWFSVLMQVDSRGPRLGVPVFLWALVLPVFLIVFRMARVHVRWLWLVIDLAVWLAALLAVEHAPSWLGHYPSGVTFAIGGMAITYRQCGQAK